MEIDNAKLLADAQLLAALFGSDDETGKENEMPDVLDSADESPAIVLESRLVEAAERISKGESTKAVCRELALSRTTVKR